MKEMFIVNRNALIGIVLIAGGAAVYFIYAKQKGMWPFFVSQEHTPQNLRRVSCAPTGTNQTRCVVAWDAVPGATKYRLEKKQLDGTWKLWYEGTQTQVTLPPAGEVLFYCDANPYSGPFTLRVRAEGSFGVSAWNQQVLYTTPCP